MAKRIAQCPEALDCPAVSDIYSLSNCISDDFADYINSWEHNGYWLFDSPSAIKKVAAQIGVSLVDTSLFYYEVHELEFDQERMLWVGFEPEAGFPSSVCVPVAASLEGFDVVSFYARSRPECSPLSCNGLASGLRVNSHCLFATFLDAIHALETGAFRNCESGHLRVFSVSSVAWV